MKAQVQIRRTLNFEVKPEAEELDGKIFEFERGWEIESTDSRYPGEIAMKLSRKELIDLGFTELPHKTIMNNLIYDLGRNRILSIGCLDSPNESMWICEVSPEGSHINDLVCIHNFDYDGQLTMYKIKMLIKCISHEQNRTRDRQDFSIT